MSLSVNFTLSNEWREEKLKSACDVSVPGSPRSVSHDCPMRPLGDASSDMQYILFLEVSHAIRKECIEYVTHGRFCVKHVGAMTVVETLRNWKHGSLLGCCAAHSHNSDSAIDKIFRLRTQIDEPYINQNQDIFHWLNL